MSNLSENFGLDVLMDNDEAVGNFLGFILNTGKAISTYYGYPYIFKSVGKPEYFARLRPGKEGKYDLCGLDVHCAGSCIWEMVHTGIDLSPSKKFPRQNRVALMSRPDGGGLVPIELITADVYPSFLEGDRFKIQVIGLPLTIEYFPDEKAYSDSLPKDKEGRQLGPANGALFPASLLVNHAPEMKDDFDPETDKLVLFSGTVKRVTVGFVNITGEGGAAFLRCRIDTCFGELELEHTLEQVKEDQQDYIREGAVVSGVCILSGDLAIDEYEDGPVKDREHDLMLLRYTFAKGEEERLKTVLREDAVYYSDATGKKIEGRDNIITRIRYVNDNRGCDIGTNMATIVEAGEGTEYEPGTRCFVLAYGENRDYDAIIFIDVDEDGMISRIKTSTDSRYRFQVDKEAPPIRNIEDFELPDSVEEAMFLRAELSLGICPEGGTLEDFRAASGKKETYSARAEKVIEKVRYYSRTGPEEKKELLFGNLFARACEDRILAEINVILPEPEEEEWFEEEYACHLSEAWEPLIKDAFDYGRMFFKDYKNYTLIEDKRSSAPTLSKELFASAAVMTQEIGEAYAVKHLADAGIGLRETENAAH